MSHLRKIQAGESQVFQRFFFHFSAKILRQMRQMEKSRERIFFLLAFLFLFLFLWLPDVRIRTKRFGKNIFELIKDEINSYF